MSTRRIPMMTEDEIQSELGWTRSMIYSLLRAPDSTPPGAVKPADTPAAAIVENACRPSRSRQRIRLRNGDGTRRYGIPPRTRAGHRVSATSGAP
jgi:hypothetical protein